MFRRVAILIIASACLAFCSMASTYRGPEAPVSATWPHWPGLQKQHLPDRRGGSHRPEVEPVLLRIAALFTHPTNRS
jgi:hypothetical protein